VDEYLVDLSIQAVATAINNDKETDHAN
jgi:hypothetical protein